VSALSAFLRGAPTIGVPALLDAGLAGFHAGAAQLRPLPRPAGSRTNPVDYCDMRDGRTAIVVFT
jgi:hypothetical protein